MNNRNLLYIYIVLGMLLLAAVGVLANVVGNIGIRRVQSTQAIDLQVVQPVVPGVATTVRWNAPLGGAQDVAFGLRTASVDQIIGVGVLNQGAAEVVFPCAVDQTAGSLVMSRAGSGEVVAWSRVRMLPPGPDCF